MMKNGKLVLSIFPGIGLFDMAFEMEGFCVVRGPDVLWGGDVRRFHPPAGKFDGVIGGPPCQSFSSLAHLVRAQGREPKFGNLIPEFERCVAEAQPAWFVMEEVRAAPEPVVPGYSVKAFLLNNAWILGEGGLGQEQERLRRFSFGVRGEGAAPNLMRWIDIAALMLPEGDRSGSLTQWTPDNSRQAKGRSPAVSGVSDGHGRSRTRHECVTGGNDKPPSVRRKMILGNGDPVPVAVGGSGKVKASVRRRAVTASDGGKSVRMARYSIADAARLQGLPEDFFAESPFRRDAQLKMIANGVALPTGRAIARAIREAMGDES